MFSHLGAVLLASGALILLSTVHSISTEAPRPQATIMLVPASSVANGVALHTHAALAAPLNAIAIGY